MTPYTRAKEKLAAIFNEAPWLKTDGKAVHLPISGMSKDHQLTWPELYALYRESVSRNCPTCGQPINDYSDADIQASENPYRRGDRVMLRNGVKESGRRFGYVAFNPRHDHLVSVVWDGMKTRTVYHVDFVEPEDVSLRQG